MRRWTIRILVVTREIPPVGGGAGRVALDLALSAASHGHRVDVLTMAYAGLPAREAHGALTIHRLDCGRRRRERSTLVEMARFTRAARRAASELRLRRAVDVVHAHAIVPDGWAALGIARDCAAALVVTAHGSDVPGYNPHRFRLAHRLAAPLWRRIVASSDALVAPSEHLAGLIRRARPSRPVALIHNGIDTRLFAVSARPRRRAFLACARLERRKNLELVVRALERVRGPIELEVVGAGPCEAELRRLARRVPGHAVRFHGPLANGSPEWRALFEGCRYFVFPSLAENLPVVLLEAQLAGLVVLASRIPGNVEALGEQASFFASLDEAGVARALEDALEVPEAELDRLAALGAARVRERFSLESSAERYLALYARLAGREVAA